MIQESQSEMPHVSEISQAARHHRQITNQSYYFRSSGH